MTVLFYPTITIWKSLYADWPAPVLMTCQTRISSLHPGLAPGSGAQNPSTSSPFVACGGSVRVGSEAPLSLLRPVPKAPRVRPIQADCMARELGENGENWQSPGEVCFVTVCGLKKEMALPKTTQKTEASPLLLPAVHLSVLTKPLRSAAVVARLRLWTWITSNAATPTRPSARHRLRS